MNILYLCHRVPYPPNKGDKIRSFHQIKALSAKHRVDLFALADTAEDIGHQASLEEFCDFVKFCMLPRGLARIRLVPELFTFRPLSLKHFYSAEFARAIHTAVETRNYDKIIVFCSSMAQYVEWVDHIPVLVDLVDVDSDKWRQYAKESHFPMSLVYRREAFWLERYEEQIYRSGSTILVTTDREANIARNNVKDAHVFVVPNGVDTSYFRPPGIALNARPPTLSFVGDMAYLPNQQAAKFLAKDILPKVQKVFPTVRLFVVGRDPTAEILTLSQNSAVKVTGTVPDVRQYLAETDVVVAPLFIASGIQNKILEAMSFGLPVVASPKALQAFPQQAAQLLETASTADEFAQRVIELLKDRELAQRKGKACRAYVEAEHNWDRSSRLLLNIVAGTFENQSQAAATTSQGANLL